MFSFLKTQYRISSLLIGMIVIAFVLGLWRYANTTPLAVANAAKIARIQSGKHCFITFREESPRTTLEFDAIVDLTNDAESVSLELDTATLGEIEKLTKLPKVTELIIQDASFSNQVIELKHLRLKSLSFLKCRFQNVTFVLPSSLETIRFDGSYFEACELDVDAELSVLQLSANFTSGEALDFIQDVNRNVATLQRLDFVRGPALSKLIEALGRGTEMTIEESQKDVTAPSGLKLNILRNHSATYLQKRLIERNENDTIRIGL